MVLTAEPLEKGARHREVNLWYTNSLHDTEGAQRWRLVQLTDGEGSLHIVSAAQPQGAPVHLSCPDEGHSVHLSSDHSHARQAWKLFQLEEVDGRWQRMKEPAASAAPAR